MTPETETKAGVETETTAAEPRSRLSPEQQRALIERRRRRAASPATEAIPPRPRDGGPIPLSLAQGRLWFLEHLHPGSPVYNLPVAIRLEGRLDTAALERALGELVRRHEALRTVFAEVDGRPVQVVQEAGGFSLPTARVRPTKAGKETEDQDASVRLLAQKEARRPFDLAAGPLVRGVLLRLAPRHHVLLLTMHHLVFDGWSRGIFFRELDALYAAFAEDGSATPVPEPPLQYGDFAVWQRGHLDGPALDGQIAWWRGRLAGAVALPLLTDRPHPAGWTDRGARLPVSLPGPLVDALAALGRSEGATLFMTLLAAYQALLARYTGEPDVVVGAPISGRTRPETEGIVGFFANTLVLRTDLDGDPTFRELLRRVRETALGAFAHQEVPFERLVAEVNAERTINRTPLTPVMIALQDALPAPLSGPRLRSSFVDVDPGTAMFDLFLNLQQGRDAGGEVRGAIEYATDLFDAATIARFAGHLRTLLEGAVADPDCRVSALPLLAEPERRRLLGAHDAAAGEAPPDDNVTIHGRFEAWAARTPEAPALLSGGHHLTYRDLDRRANRLAHRLRALGVGPGVAVGLCLARSPGLVVGLLAILKAGGIAVPLDPAYPPERLAFMLDDSRALVLVGDEPSVARLATVPVRTVLLDRDRAEIEREPDGSPVVDLAADAPAYVVYTSGSTGTPKGVVGLHRGAVNLARWLGSTYPFAAGETGCHVTSFSFVDAIWDLFGPLLNGAPTRLVDEEDRKDPRRLIEVLAQAGAARVIVVASMLRAILETGVDLQTALPDLRFWFSSAELLPPELAARFYRQAPHATLINTYGSSEVTAVVTWHEVARSVDRLPRVPIGRPIANARVLVLDGRGEPVPVGVPGEICVGGAPVARGYLRRPELTAERFVPDPDPDPDPVAARPDARLFRTGDRGRVLANGDLEFLGRIDRQVKIRGFRVEPGEIE
ncbi:MAG TPA: amino acid adenylation domain-containing protein, partial [Thermomicrobiales bacterium]|nr:amino acid adenylation domain-containing protein [Thermomicrobiales bacterium]